MRDLFVVIVFLFCNRRILYFQGNQSSSAAIVVGLEFRVPPLVGENNKGKILKRGLNYQLLSVGLLKLTFQRHLITGETMGKEQLCNYKQLSTCKV